MVFAEGRPRFSTASDRRWTFDAEAICSGWHPRRGASGWLTCLTRSLLRVAAVYPSRRIWAEVKWCVLWLIATAVGVPLLVLAVFHAGRPGTA